MDSEEGSETEGEDEEEEGGSIRWPPWAKVQMVRAGLTGLHNYGVAHDKAAAATRAAYTAATGDPYPEPVVSDAWERTAQQQEGLCAWPSGNHAEMQKVWEPLIADLQFQLGSDEHSANAIRRKAIELTKKFLQTCSIKNLPAHEKGWLLDKNKPVLAEVRDVLLAGYADKDGNTTVYRFLQDAWNRSSSFREAFGKLHNVTTLDTLWLQLQQVYPKMNRVTLKLKKERNFAKVQVSSTTSNARWCSAGC